MTRGAQRRSMGRWLVGTAAAGLLLTAGVLLLPGPAEEAHAGPARSVTTYAAEIEAPAPLAPLRALAAGQGAKAALATDEAPVRRAPRDPLHAVMAVEGADKQVYVDVAALRDSAPGKAILRCLPRGDRRELKRLREEAGFDPFEQIERVAVVGELAVLSGDFAGVDWQKVERHRSRVEPYGEHGLLYLPDEDAPWRRGFATWKDQIALGGGHRDALVAAIDRLEGRAPLGRRVRTAGHASGVLPAGALFEIMDLSRDVAGPLAGLLEEQGAQVQFRVDAGDWGLKVGVELLDGDTDSVDALSSGVEAALQGGIRESQQAHLGPILAGLAMAKGGGGDLKLTLPITLGMLEGMLGPCVREGVDPG